MQCNALPRVGDVAACDDLRLSSCPSVQPADSWRSSTIGFPIIIVAIIVLVIVIAVLIFIGLIVVVDLVVVIVVVIVGVIFMGLII